MGMLKKIKGKMHEGEDNREKVEPRKGRKEFVDEKGYIQELATRERVKAKKVKEEAEGKKEKEKEKIRKRFRRKGAMNLLTLTEEQKLG